jgi:hypothetical protein
LARSSRRQARDRRCRDGLSGSARCNAESNATYGMPRVAWPS